MDKTNSNGSYVIIVKSNAIVKINAIVFSDSGLEIASSQTIQTPTAGLGNTKTITDLIIDLSGTNSSLILYGVNCDLSTYWAVGENGKIFYYDSAWINKPSGVLGTLYDIDCPVYNNFWIVGEKGILLHSSDFGESWNSKTIGTNTNLYNVEFISGFYGWIVGEAGNIYTTVNEALLFMM